MKRTGPTNLFLRKLITKLKKVAKEENAPIWRVVAYHLEKPRRKKVIVNLNKLEKLAKEGETIIIPGKLLGGGLLTKKLTVVYFSASKEALNKLKKSGSKGITLEEYLKENPKGSNTRIFIWGEKNDNNWCNK